MLVIGGDAERWPITTTILEKMIGETSLNCIFGPLFLSGIYFCFNFAIIKLFKLIVIIFINIDKLLLPKA